VSNVNVENKKNKTPAQHTAAQQVVGAG